MKTTTKQQFAQAGLFLAGLIPLGVGYGLDRWLNAHPDQSLHTVLVGGCTLAGWLLLGLFTGQKRTSILWAHGGSLFFLVLSAVQVFLLGGFVLPYPLSVLPQWFFMPMIGVTSKLLFFMPQKDMFMIFVISCLFTCLAYWLGAALNRGARPVHAPVAGRR